MLLFYIRHGDPIYNPDCLTEFGKLQADALSKRLALFGIDKIYSSTSIRALQTAEPTARLLHKEIIQQDWCLERYVMQELGVLVDGKRRWLFQRPEYRRLFVSKGMEQLGHRWWSHPAFAEYEYQKGYERIQQEAYKFLEALGYKYDDTIGAYRVLCENDERVALFAHQGFGMAFMSAVLNIPYPKFCISFDFGHSSMTVIEFRNEEGISIPQVLSLSNDSHLYREGLPTNYQNRIGF